MPGCYQSLVLPITAVSSLPSFYCLHTWPAIENMLSEHGWMALGIRKREAFSKYAVVLLRYVELIRAHGIRNRWDL